MSDVVERFDARLARGASGLLLEFNDAGVLAAADVHVARRLAALTGGADDAVVLATALAVRAPRIGHVFVDLERISETATVDVDDPIDLTTLPWPSPSGWVAAGRGERARRPGSSAAAGGQRALPRPLLARGAAGRGRPRGARRRRRRRADGRARRRHHASVHGRDARRQAEAGSRRRGAPPPGGRGRRPGHRQDDDRRPHRRAARGAGTRRGRRAPARRARRPDRQGRRTARRGGPRRGRAPERRPRDPRAAARARGLDPPPPARLEARHPQPLPPRPRQPAPLRRRDRRRDLDGLALPDGAAHRGRPARGPPHPRRRPGPAHLDRGRRGARRHRRPRRRQPTPEPGGARRRRGSNRHRPSRARHRAADVQVGDGIVVLGTVHRFGGGIERLADAIHAGDADAAIGALTDESITWINADVGDPAALDQLSPVRDGAVAHRPRRHRGRPRRRRGPSHPRARRLPRPLRPPPRPPRRRDLDAAHRDLAGRRAAGLRRRALVRRPPAARHRERPRHPPLQRRHRRRRHLTHRPPDRSLRAPGRDCLLQPYSTQPPSRPSTP